MNSMIKVQPESKPIILSDEEWQAEYDRLADEIGVAHDQESWAVNTRGHVWKLDDFGHVDATARFWENHNGPECIACGYTFCYHCYDIPPKACTVVTVDARFEEA